MNVPFAHYPDLADKVAVVTGSSRGIGLATSMQLAANGVKVVINGRDPAAIGTAVAQVRSSGGTAIGVPADCTRLEDMQALREAAEGQLGPVDILCAFAADQGRGSRPGPIEQVSPEEWHAGIHGSLTATFYALTAFLPGMLARQRGAIVTMASTAGRHASQAPAAYGVAKAGVILLTKQVARDAGPFGVRVNCVSPSAIGSDRLKEKMSAEQFQQLARSFPLGRVGEPADVASATLFLISDASSWITGVTLDITGGRELF